MEMGVKWISKKGSKNFHRVRGSVLWCKACGTKFRLEPTWKCHQHGVCSTKCKEKLNGSN